MRLITIEEHIPGTAIATAEEIGVAKDAPYMVKASGKGLPYVPDGSMFDISEKRVADMVERCLFEAVDGNAAVIPYLRKNICYGIPYIALSVPCDKNKFTKYRHKFYYILDKKT